MSDPVGHKPFITSVLDQDLYKCSMAQAVCELYPRADATYVFRDLGDRQDYSQEFASELGRQIAAMADLRLQPQELMWLRHVCPYLKEWYLRTLQAHRFDPNQVKWGIVDGRLTLTVHGPWREAIYWEVPLLALISETYFKTVDTSWRDTQGVREKFKGRTAMKGMKLASAGCHFADFGTRRRRSFGIHRDAVEMLEDRRGFVGTSNMALARHFSVKPIGTMAHEWIMAISVLKSLRHANRYALEDWVSVYDGRLGIALTDTFGLEPFLSDFGIRLAKLFDGVRHDSGSPLKFFRKIVKHYRGLGIDPRKKTIVFSDGLDVDMAIALANLCDGVIGCSFGIGTNLTNDFDTPALNAVIKMSAVNGIPVVKLSDSLGKKMGDSSALAEAEYVFRDKKIRVENEIDLEEEDE